MGWFRGSGRIGMLGVAVAGMLVVTCPTRGQDAGSPGSPGFPGSPEAVEGVGEGERSLRIYTLRHSQAREAHVLLSTLMEEAPSIVEHERTRKLLVRGTPAEHAEVARLLAEVIDVPAAAPGPRPPAPGAGDEEARGASRVVRVAWLVAGGEEAISGTQPLPPRLERVAAELEAGGLENVRLAAELTVAARTEERFRLTAQKHLASAWDVEVQGTLGAGGAGYDDLSLQLVAETRLPLEPKEDGYREEGASVQTSLAIPLGRPVVLAAAPSGGAMASVFVVTVTAMEEAAPPVEREGE